MNRTCPECGSADFVYSAGWVSCKQCGRVVDYADVKLSDF